MTTLRRHRGLQAVFVVCVCFLSVSGQKLYFPPAGSWDRRTPEQAKLDPVKLKVAIEFAIASEAKAPRDLLLAHLQTFGREPYGEPVGPFKERGPATGVILRGGYLVAEWGEPSRVDMTFSVTKSFLSTTVGLALDRKMIRSLQDKVIDYYPPVLPANTSVRLDDPQMITRPVFVDIFSTAGDRKVTWDNFLRQTSDWEGTLWGKPDWADRPDRDPNNWLLRKRNEPGTSWEYNDVRVNALALATLNVWRRPLPEVLREYVMDEIGASNTWRWYGYENSWVVIDGRAVQSVSGGGHWGGGLFINAYDMARFGLMTARGGRWRDKQILSDEFVKQAKSPTPVQPTYGFMNWYLNTDKKLYPNAPASAFAHLGNGTNIIYIDPENDLVVVVRWIENNKIDEFIGKLNASLVK